MHFTAPLLHSSATPVTEEDMYSLATIDESSLYASPLSRLRFGNADRDTIINWILSRNAKSLEDCEESIEEHYLNGDKARKWFLYVRDTDEDIPIYQPANSDDPEIKRASTETTPKKGRIVAKAGWAWRPKTWLEDADRETEKAQKAAKENPEATPAPQPFPNENLELRAITIQLISGLPRNAIAGKEHYLLNELSTLASYHRRGLGSKLVKPICDLADRENKVCFLIATEIGYPLYQRLGFEVVETVSIDLGHWDPTGTKYTFRSMIRQPKELKAASQEAGEEVSSGQPKSGSNTHTEDSVPLSYKNLRLQR